MFERVWRGTECQLRLTLDVISEVLRSL